MSTALEILIGAGGTVAALLAVLLPVIRAQGSNLRRQIEGKARTCAASWSRYAGTCAPMWHRCAPTWVKCAVTCATWASALPASSRVCLTGPWRPTIMWADPAREGSPFSTDT